MENTATSHNVVVCTLCSCYPWPVLGLPPSWYKDPAYRARMVREPRKVLSEMGLELADDVQITVHDSSSEVRWLVLPERPAGTEDLSEEQLVPLITRDAMVGVAKVDGTVSAPLDIEGPAAPPRSNGELVFAEPWESRAFGMAVSPVRGGRVHLAAVPGGADRPDRAPGRPHRPRASTGTTTGTGWARWRTCWPTAAPCCADEVTARARTLARRPTGHDHPH